ncbi:MAG: putative lipopolysaccharide heptosyltransferase III [Thermodesulfovibrionia bacterium]|nr:putative lipopolysaccharide heptosyltransferase III [Thermodesulfovibrionia bacterium]
MKKRPSEFKDVKKILVIKLRHIGDVLLTVPVFRALKKAFPGAEISALINSGTEAVLHGNPLIDRIISFDRNIKGLPTLRRIAGEARFLNRLRSEDFDMTVDLTGGDRAAVASFFSGARYRIGWKPDRGLAGKRFFYTHNVDPEGDKHMVLQNIGILEGSGIRAGDISVDFYTPAPEREGAADMLNKNNMYSRSAIVHIHPTSRWLFKCWKDEYMAEMISWLIGNGAGVILTSSPDRNEIEKAGRIISLVRSGGGKDDDGLLNLAGKTSIKQLGAISEAADLFFGVDSAPMHIAAAVNTPVVALFGPSGAFNWGPWDNRYSVESTGHRAGQAEPYSNKNGIQTFGMHTVIQRSYDCVPCGRAGCDGSKKSRCLDDITPEEVKAVIEKKLKEIKK